jgi:error-prone DNA polymerase
MPEVSLKSLAENAEGLIGLSGCRRGLIPSLILKKSYAEAREAAQAYKAVFEEDAFFVELSETLLPGSRGLNRYLQELAEVEGLTPVATNNVHYALKEDFFVHDVLTCVRTLTRLEDVHPERRLNAENYLKGEDEMKEAFAIFQGALRAASEAAAMCECPVELGVPSFPSFEVPAGFRSAREYLKHLVFRGAEDRYGKVTPEVKERLDHELYVIEKLGYEDYFLVVWDLVEFARGQGIRNGGRGSAADSAVAYCLRITDVDPIAQNLLFERFLSLERGEKPDIDVDFDARRRDEVSTYVRGKYGEDHVAAVATYNTFRGRSAIRDAGKAMGYSADEIDLIAKRLPHYAALGKDAFESIPELRDLGMPPKKLETLLRVAGRLANLPRFLATHLGGLVISRFPVTYLCPVERSAKGVTIVQFDKDDVEDLGLVKIDLLSLRTLGAIDDSLGYIEGGPKASAGGSDDDLAVRAPALDYDRIPLDDEDTYRRLRSADTVGVFQLESPAQRALQARLGANNIEDVVASVALIRPGPIKGDMVEPFIKRRQGLEQVAYLEPRLEPILKKTYGVILFQEQVIEIASTIAGFSPGEADQLRRVMTHSRSGGEMDRLGGLFVSKAVERGVSEEVARAIFQCMKGYASYGFCEAHARAFGTTAYKTAYLIEHHPAEFFGAILNNEPMGYYPVSTVCIEARSHGVKVTGPSLNRSAKDLVVDSGEIVLPFKMINGMSEKVMEAIERERENGPFKAFQDFVGRVRPPVDVLKAMVMCGTFDEFGVSRKKLVWSLSTRYEDAGVPVARDGALVEEPPEDDSLAGPDFTLAEKVGFEYSILGLGVSGHPMAVWRETLRKSRFVGSQEIKAVSHGEYVKVGGIPVRPHRPPTRSGKTVVFLSLEDEDGLIDVTCFESVYKKYGKFLFPGEIIPLGIWGQVQKRGNGVSVNARTIFPLSYVLRGPGQARAK